MKAALIGHGIGASLTPPMHEAEGRALGLDYSYGRMDTSRPPWFNRDLPEMIREAEEQGFAGLNITHPFKAAVLDCVDEASATVRAIGAANTVVFRDGRRIAHNTDKIGFFQALRDIGASVARSHVLVLGAGGAGPAVGMALLEAGAARLEFVDPVPGKAASAAGCLLRAWPGVKIEAHESAATVPLATIDGAVNASPVGMTGHPGLPLDPALLPPEVWVADIVYFPRETELLRRARARGMRVLPGTAMALHQAVAAFELITGHVPDAGRMAASLEAMLAMPATSDSEGVNR